MSFLQLEQRRIEREIRRRRRTATSRARASWRGRAEGVRRDGHRDGADRVSERRPTSWIPRPRRSRARAGAYESGRRAGRAKANRPVRRGRRCHRRPAGGAAGARGRGRGAALPAHDRAGAAAHARGRGAAGQAHRAERHVGQERADRGEPAARGVDRQALHRARPDAARPDPGGQPGPDPGGREVRLAPRLQVLDLRHVVDPPGDHPRAGRPVAHDPHPGAHGGADEPGARARSAR